MTKNITQHFSLAETRITSTGLDNQPNQEEEVRILNTATNMEVVRAILGRKSIKINSWFRSAAVNAKVGGSKTSEHRLGAAVDFTCASFGTPLDVCKTLVHYAHVINYNQLIYEGTWVHISFPPAGVQGKNQTLTYRNGKYLQGIQS